MFALGGTPHLASAASLWVTGSISILYPMGNGAYVVAIEGVTAPNCGATGTSRYFYMAVGQNGVVSDGLRILAATAIAAFSMGKAISIVYDDGSASCFVSALTVQ